MLYNTIIDEGLGSLSVDEYPRPLLCQSSEGIHLSWWNPSRLKFILSNFEIIKPGPLKKEKKLKLTFLRLGDIYRWSTYLHAPKTAELTISVSPLLAPIFLSRVNHFSITEKKHVRCPCIDIDKLMSFQACKTQNSKVHTPKWMKILL